MAKDYSKIKALAQSIIECIGDEPEGGDGTDIEHSEEDRGAPGPTKLDTPALGIPTADDSEEKHKKRRDDVVALLTSTLASKFNK